MAQGWVGRIASSMRAVLVGLALATALSACAPRYTAMSFHPGWSRANGDEPAAQDDAYGAEVATNLQERYDDSQVDCGGATRPAVLCSGILFRGTNFSPAYHSWNPNPNSPKRNVSFSWLRHDAQFRSVNTAWYTHGFVVIPLFYADRVGRLDPYYKLQIACAFPIDAHTDARNDDGCGEYINFPETSRPCAVLGIDTAEAYVDYYREEPRFAYLCSIALSIGEAHTSANFTMFIDTIQGLGDKAFDIWNELLVREWPQDIHTTIPLEAFFYQAGTTGLDGARSDQIDFKAQSGKWVPIIRFDMPQTIGARATFHYVPSEQTP